MEEDDWVEVHTGVPGAQFDLVRSLLAGAGVRVHVQTVGSDRWHSVGAMGAITGVPTDFNAARILVRPTIRKRLCRFSRRPRRAAWP